MLFHNVIFEAAQFLVQNVSSVCDDTYPRRIDLKEEEKGDRAIDLGTDPRKRNEDSCNEGRSSRQAASIHQRAASTQNDAIFIKIRACRRVTFPLRSS